MIEQLIAQYSPLGFSYAVAIFLLWKGYTQDERFLTTLVKLEESIRAHTEQKDKALALIAASKQGCAIKQNGNS